MFGIFLELGAWNLELPLCPIVPNRLDRATFFGLFAARFFLRGLRLFINVGITSVVVALEVVGRRFAAKIAVNALVIHVVLAGDALRILVRHISHIASLFGIAPTGNLPVLAKINDPGLRPVAVVKRD